MSQLLQCPNGHYYTDDNESCPYCAGGVSQGVERGFTSPIGVTLPASNSGETQMPPSIPYPGIGTAPVGSAGPTVPPQMPEKTQPVRMRPITEPSPLVSGGSVSHGAEAEKEDDSNYVVGWLAAIEGPYCGKSFELHNGYTDIGRTEGDIVLEKDQQVSSSRNVSVSYDSMNNCFYVSAGESRNIVHVNGTALIRGNSRELNPYDSIRIGQTKLLFVPFCCEQFSWINGEMGEKKK